MSPGAPLAWCSEVQWGDQVPSGLVIAYQVRCYNVVAEQWLMYSCLRSLTTANDGSKWQTT